MKKLLPYFFLLFFIASGSLSLPGLTQAANTCTPVSGSNPVKYTCTPIANPVPTLCTSNPIAGTMTCPFVPANYTAPGQTSKAAGFISASPTSVKPGDTITLTWSTSNATKCAITGLAADVNTSGSTSLVPNSSTTYTLSCQDKEPPGASHTLSSTQVTVTTPPATTPPVNTGGTCAWDKSLIPPGYVCSNPSGVLPPDGECHKLTSVTVGREMACKTQPAGWSCIQPGTPICEPPTIPAPPAPTSISCKAGESSDLTCELTTSVPSNCSATTGGMTCDGYPKNYDCSKTGATSAANTYACTEQKIFSCTGNYGGVFGQTKWICPALAAPPSNCKTTTNAAGQSRTECTGTPPASAYTCNVTKQASVWFGGAGQMQCGSTVVLPPTSPSGSGSGGQGGGAPSTGEGTGGNTPLDYQPLEPIPGFTSGLGSLDIPNLLARLFKILFAVGALLAVVMLVIGGIQYMVSEVVDTKSFARERLLAALYGLLILAGSYLILNTINPDLVSLKFFGNSGLSTLNPSSTGNGPITFTNPNVLDQLQQFSGHTVLSVDGQPGYTYANTAATTNPGVIAGIEGFTNGCSSLSGTIDTMPSEVSGISATTLYCYDSNPTSQ